MKPTIPLVAAALLGLLVPALAGNTDPTDRTTTWVTPSGFSQPAECQWSYTIRYSVRDDRSDDPPDDCLNRVTDAYAHTIADGMQVWGYAWAEDNCEPVMAAAAISSSSSGLVSVFATKIPEGCPYRMIGDWNPRVRLRVHQSNPPGAAAAGAQMKGEIEALDLRVDLGQALVVKSDAKMAYEGISVWILGTGLTIPIPFTSSVSTAPREQTLEDIVHREKSISTATATYVGRVWASAMADSTILNWTGISEAWVWDSRPKLDLHGECLAPCGGQAFVVYGWHLP